MAIETRDIGGGPASEVFRADDRDVLQGAAWLRDGRLVYSVRQPGRGTSAGTVPCSHWQMPVDDNGRPRGGSRPLAGWLPQCVAAISFTADGKGALYLQFALEDAIHVVDLDAAGQRVNARRLTFTEGRNIPSGWTADNQSVVFMSDSGGRAALFTQGLTADTSQLLTNQPGIVGAARLTPDGAAVLYLVEPSWRGSRMQRLMRVALTGGPSREIASGDFVNGGARCTEGPVWLCAIAERSADRASWSSRRSVHREGVIESSPAWTSTRRRIFGGHSRPTAVASRCSTREAHGCGSFRSRVFRRMTSTLVMTARWGTSASRATAKA